MRKIKLFILLVGIAFVTVNTVTAQEDSAIRLRLSRDFGYSSGTGKIQGTFSMRVSGPDDFMRVVYYIDGREIGESEEEPFRLRFQTGDFNLGVHTVYAIGITEDGRRLESNHIRAEFVCADEGWGAAMDILVPMLGLIFLAIVLSFAAVLLTSRKLKALPLGAPRDYGFAGGTICPRCQRPFSRHILAPNLLVGKLERCPFCGKWGVVKAEPIEKLRAAEAAELAGSGDVEGASSMSEDERLRKELEESRFQDLV